MIKQAIIASALLAAGPVLAQATPPAGPPDTSTPATPSSSQPETSGTTSPPPADQPTPSSDPAAAATQAPAADTGDALKSTIDADWAKYDTNKNDSLSRAEMGKWLTDLQAAAGKKKPDAAQLSGAFKKADTDKNSAVSREELAAYLKS